MNDAALRHYCAMFSKSKFILQSLKLVTCSVSRNISNPQRTFNPNRMPQPRAGLEQLHKLHQAKRNKAQTKVPDKISWQVVGNGKQGCARSLYLNTSVARYLFNCGETTQKTVTEFVGGQSISKLTNIFITKNNWNNFGGLPGMCLTLNASGAPDVRLHGPRGLMKIFDALQHFVVLFDFGVHYHDHLEDGAFVDNAIQVQHVVLQPSDTASKVFASEPKYCKWSTDLQMSNADPDSIPKVEIDQTVFAYIVTLNPKPGKIDIKKCIELGVQPGPLIGVLKGGHSVTLENGKTVLPSDVTLEPEKAQKYIVLDCPSLDYLPSLLNSEALKFNQSLDNLIGIFHFSALQVVEHPDYQTWMNSFGKEVQHVMLNENSFDYATLNALKENEKFHKIAPQVFHQMLGGEETTNKASYDNIIGNCLQAETNLELECRPRQGKIKRPDFNQDQTLKTELEAVEDLDQLMAKVKTDIDNVLNPEAPEYPKITFLGTGSSLPNKYRNVSSILVESQPDNFIMMDCGEGTYLQMCRFFGVEKAAFVLRNLKAIYISHLHTDHHLGLIQLVNERDKSFQNEEPSKMFILAPYRIANYLTLYHKYFEPILTNLVHIRNEHLLPTNIPGQASSNVQMLYQEIKQDLLEHTKMKSLKTCRVFHCPSAFGFAMTNPQGFKIVYSGDTRPTDALIQLGQDEEPTDLLIHEATLEHRMLADCKLKRHSTFTEAIQVAQDMQAKQAIMTHFSQRYAKVPIFDEFESKDGEPLENVGIAFDMTSVCPQTFKVIRQTYPVLKAVFKDALEEVYSRSDNIRGKRFDQAIAASLNIDGDEIFDEPERKKIKKFSDFAIKAQE